MRRRGVPCGCADNGGCCGLKEKLAILWDRTIGSILSINHTTPDGDGDFTISEGENIHIVPDGNGIEISAVLPASALKYRGTVGTGGTIATLPDADDDNAGDVYIAVSDATVPVTYHTGDVLISNGSTWEVVPSGDDLIPIVTSWTNPLSDGNVPSEKLVKESMDTLIATVNTIPPNNGNFGVTGGLNVAINTETNGISIASETITQRLAEGDSKRAILLAGVDNSVSTNEVYVKAFRNNRFSINPAQNYIEVPKIQLSNPEPDLLVAVFKGMTYHDQTNNSPAINKLDGSRLISGSSMTILGKAYTVTFTINRTQIATVGGYIMYVCTIDDGHLQSGTYNAYFKDQWVWIRLED